MASVSFLKSDVPVLVNEHLNTESGYILNGEETLELMLEKESKHRVKDKAVGSAAAMRAGNLAEKERLRAVTVAEATKRREELERHAKWLADRERREGLLSNLVVS